MQVADLFVAQLVDRVRRSPSIVGSARPESSTTLSYHSLSRPAGAISRALRLPKVSMNVLGLTRRRLRRGLDVQPLGPLEHVRPVRVRVQHQQHVRRGRSGQIEARSRSGSTSRKSPSAHGSTSAAGVLIGEVPATLTPAFSARIAQVCAGGSR
jgi:hypothetical protein